MLVQASGTPFVFCHEFFKFSAAVKLQVSRYMVLFSDAVEVLSAAKENLSCGNCRRSAEYLIELVYREYLEFRAGFYDVTLATLGLNVNLSVAGCRRGRDRVAFAELLFLVDGLSRPCLIAG